MREKSDPPPRPSKPPSKKGTLLNWFPTESKSAYSATVKKETKEKKEKKEEEGEEPTKKKPKLE